MKNTQRVIFPLGWMFLLVMPTVVGAQQDNNLIKFETLKSVDQVTQEIQKVAKEYGYGVLSTRNMKTILAKKGQQIDPNVVILELCSPVHAKSAIDISPAVSTVLPCRISVWETNGRTTLAMVKPTRLLGMTNSSKKIQEIAKQVEQELHGLMKNVAISKKAQ